MNNTMLATKDNVSIEPEDELIFPGQKRAFTLQVKDECGADNLVLYVEGNEIAFDEAEFFDFGECLSKQPCFTANSATRWGEGYQWESIQPLFNVLVEEGILRKLAKGEVAPDHHHGRCVAGRNKLLGDASTTMPRTWSECEAITHELVGDSIELGYLELVVPIFRIAHIYLDSDGRQVGEANVFPPALRLDIETEWRSCHYAGSRYQDEKMMNATALRVMSTHWSEMMLGIKYIRDAYFTRVNKSGNEMTLGDLERLTVMVLALPTYLLQKRNNPVKNGELHPVLSSMFRVTDGVRMTAHQMLFLTDKDTRSEDPNRVVSSADIYAYAEKNASFYSPHGVCAGPRIMIEQLLNVLIDGKLEDDVADTEFSDAVKMALSELEPAMNYGLRSLQAFAIVHSLWTVMTHALDDLARFTQSLPDNDSPEMQEFKRRMNASAQELGESHLGSSERRSDREHIYADMFKQCALGLGEIEEFTDRVVPTAPDDHPKVKKLLVDSIHKKLCQLNMSGVDLAIAGAQIDYLVNSLVSYFCYEQAVLKASGEIQRDINRLLGRDCANRALKASDLSAAIIMASTDVDPSQTEDEQLLSTDMYELFSVRMEVTESKITGYYD